MHVLWLGVEQFPNSKKENQQKKNQPKIEEWVTQEQSDKKWI